MEKKRIIYAMIVVITLIISMTIFNIQKNKSYEIKTIEDIKNIKLSMIKIEDGESVVIKSVPESGNWIMTYNCEDDDTKIFWEESTKKLHVKEATETECVIKFEKSKSAINVVSMYVDDIYVGELEENKSYRLLSSECANGENATWDGIHSTISITPLRKNTHCKLYFEEAPYLFNQILLDNEAQSDASINFAQVSSDTNGKGLYYTEDAQNYGEDYKRIYYYRGRVDNNWVSFGGFFWRIVRTTSEEGVKLAYSGNAGGNSSAFISLSSAFNTVSSNKYYVGYTYNTSGYTNIPQTDSTIKTVIDNWYDINLKTNENYLSKTAIYCNDKSSERLVMSTYYVWYFPAYDRIQLNKRPNFACPNENLSRYTKNTTTGNGYLTNPISILTGDEVYFSGLIYSTGNLNSYIMDNATAVSYWLNSPAYYGGSSAVSLSHVVNTNGTISMSDLKVTIGVRPAVALKSCVTSTSGDGTIDNPYSLSDKACK